MTQLTIERAQNCNFKSKWGFSVPNLAFFQKNVGPKNFRQPKIYRWTKQMPPPLQKRH